MTKQYNFVANWKMNLSYMSAQELTKNIIKKYIELKEKGFKHNIILCPAHTYLSSVNALFCKAQKNMQPLSSDNHILDSNLWLGAQDCSAYKIGAYTGDVSANMLADIGCQHVIIGHSERRINYQENNYILRSKIEQALIEGLKVIFCIGESQQERKLGQTKQILQKQLEIFMDIVVKNPIDPQLSNNVIISSLTKGNIMIAYEPVWAIGTGVTPDPDEVEKTVRIICKELDFIKDKIAMDKDLQILYGGSVSEKNARNILSKENINGLLIGSASLKFDSFYNILNLDFSNDL